MNLLVVAQSQEWMVFDTSNSTIPSNYVTSIAEDLEGNIWVGTYGGLISISENVWRIYNTNNSNLPSNGIETIAVDSNNVKWIGLSNNGLVKYYNDIWEQYDAQNLILSSSCVTQIIVDKYNRKWVAAGSVLVIDDTSLISYTVENSGLPSGNIPSIDVNDLLNVWICMQSIIPIYAGGLVKYDGTDWTIYNYDTPGFSTGNIYYVECDKDTIWVGTDWGLSKYDGLQWVTYLEENSGLPDNHVNSILADPDGTKWIGVGRATFDRKGAFVKYNNENFTVFDTTNSPILPGYVTYIFKDSHQNKWIAIQPYWDQNTTTAYGGGLTVYNENGVVLSVEEKNDEITLKEFNLANNYPNPFNPSTTIRYRIPETGLVTLKVYDVLGSEIVTLVNEEKQNGNYEVEFNGSNLSSGIYFYRLQATPLGGQAGNFSDTKKFILLK